MSDLDTFMQIVKKRRSTRNFRPDPISDEVVRQILDAGYWAMSGGNSQPWEFIVIKDRDRRLKIGALQSATRKWTSPLEGSRAPAFRHPGGLNRNGGPPPFTVAPVLVAILGDPRTLMTSVASATIFTGERETFHQGMANAAMVMHLAATAAGLNSEWVSVSPLWEESLKNLLGVPELYRLPLLAALGHADKEPGPGFRRNLEDIVHDETYDSSKFRSSEAVLNYITEIHQRRAGGSQGK